MKKVQDVTSPAISERQLSDDACGSDGNEVSAEEEHEIGSISSPSQEDASDQEENNDEGTEGAEDGEQHTHPGEDPGESSTVPTHKSSPEPRSSPEPSRSSIKRHSALAEAPSPANDDADNELPNSTRIYPAALHPSKVIRERMALRSSKAARERIVHWKTKTSIEAIARANTPRSRSSGHVPDESARGSSSSLPLVLRDEYNQPLFMPGYAPAKVLSEAVGTRTIGEQTCHRLSTDKSSDERDSDSTVSTTILPRDESPGHCASAVETLGDAAEPAEGRGPVPVLEDEDTHSDGSESLDGYDGSDEGRYQATLDEADLPIRPSRGQDENVETDGVGPATGLAGTKRKRGRSVDDADRRPARRLERGYLSS